MNFTNIKGVGGVIDGPRYWEGNLGLWDGRLYGKINNKRVYNQVRNHLYMPRILLIKNKISREIKR